MLHTYMFKLSSAIVHTIFSGALIYLSLLHFIQGVMMTHGNVLATGSAVMTIVPGLGSKDVYLAYLPLAHILELAAEVNTFQICLDFEL